MFKKSFVLLAAGALVVIGAQSAAAHVEVKADNPRALAKDVTLTLSAESESASAGIAELRVVLPKGIAPADVSFESGPKSWALSATSDGFRVKGAPLPVGEDVEVAVAVKQLPDAEELVFKTLQTYGDGKVDRWIELDEHGATEEEGDHSHSGNPAPVLKLRAAALETSPAPTPSAPTPSTPAPASDSPSPVASEADGDDNGGMSGGTWAAIGAGGVVAAGVGYLVVRRRGQAAE
ncbi:DUF1775 domain-containing protein [Streptomyces roseirectus]|uniref:DUF1775 domain-containing protein n=1 Tax=Streptomyces roseirectus TaxID=2768066 RepID=A0A7H0I9Y4_9ACTN|nr:DUF1775 domain-containing protein [Streptomyces roseirectus]QNP69600.1 DUF1775 domain-containing protein [Streptomyces roseirectus]